MRYTETKQDAEIKDQFDLVRVGFISAITSPYRLLSEISTKIMFLDRVVIEKTLVVSAVIDLLILLFCFVQYLITGKINLVVGIVPVIPVGTVLVITAVLAWVISFKFEGSNVTQTESVTKPTESEVNYDTSLEDDISEIDIPPTGQSSLSNELDSILNDSTSRPINPSAVRLDDIDLLDNIINPSELSDLDVSSFFGVDDIPVKSELDKEILKDLVSGELSSSKVPMDSVGDTITRNTTSMGIDKYKEELL